jgi:hypothetical protein
MTTSVVCRGCGGELIRSEIEHGSCGHCGRRYVGYEPWGGSPLENIVPPPRRGTRFVNPSAAPAEKPVREVRGRRGSRPFRRLAFWTVAR